MSEQESGKCGCCGKNKPLARRYYYYNINCECCGGGGHFEIVRYCESCAPKPPETIKVSLSMKPIE